MSGIRIWGSVRNLDVYGNTVYVAPAPSGVAKAFSLGTTGSNYAYNVHVRNNIFYVAGARLVDATSTAVSAAIDFTLQGNDYYATQKFSIKWKDTVYTSMASWQTASGQEQLNGASTGRTVNPQLTSPGNGGTIDGTGLSLTAMTAYKLTSASPMIDAGLDLPALFGTAVGGRDFYGRTVPAGSGFDIGAHEAG